MAKAYYPKVGKSFNQVQQEIAENQNQLREVYDYIAENPGTSFRDIMDAVGISAVELNQVLRRLYTDDLITSS